MKKLIFSILPVLILVFGFFSFIHQAHALGTGQPTVTLTSPNGGETLTVGETYRITWNSSSNADKVTLGYSFGEGSLNWFKDNSANNIPNTGYYDWKVYIGNHVMPAQIKIYIIVYNTGTGSVSDQSDNFFTVKSNTVVNPPVTTPTPYIEMEPNFTITQDTSAFYAKWYYMPATEGTSWFEYVDNKDMRNPSIGFTPYEGTDGRTKHPISASGGPAISINPATLKPATLYYIRYCIDAVATGKICSEPITFTTLSSPITGTPATYPPNEKVLLMGGSNASQNFNDIWSSSNMADWKNLVADGSTNNVWGRRNFFKTLFFNGKIYLIGGQGNPGRNEREEVWSSSDGVNWQKASILPWTSDPYEHAKSYAVYNGKIWAFGGFNHSPARAGNMYLNDVWSYDGNTWKKEPNAPWSGRDLIGTAVYNSKLWIVGGYIGSSETTKEVWSFDGANWKQEASLPYSMAFRGGEQPLATFQNKMWIFGNLQYSGNNVLSFDGTNWQQSSAPWSTRADHSNFIVNNRVYIFGGLHSEDRTPPVNLNEVWSFDGANWLELPKAPWTGRGYFDGVVVPINFGNTLVPVPTPVAVFPTPIPTPAPVADTQNGCAIGYKFSATTGQPCKSVSVNQQTPPISVVDKVVQNFDTNLKFGSRSAKVADLQNKLIELGFLKAGNVTGYFGKITAGALCSFQVENKIFKEDDPSCGLNFGPKTRAILNK